MNKLIESASDLITPRQETRAGFISMALEKNYLAVPYIEEAKALKSLAKRVEKPIDLLNVEDLRSGLLTASGLSAKALNHLEKDDEIIAIKGLIDEFLEPAGENFIDELVYRYLLIKGDALGGQARNLAGTLGQRKFLRALISVFNVAGVDYQWKNNNKKSDWIEKSKDDVGIENHIKYMYWQKNVKDKLLVMNVNVPLVRKNVDLCVLNGKPKDLKIGKNSIVKNPTRYLALGELKGGIDPAGADEHWKTANSALNRIRSGFGQDNLTPKTFFISAAIETAMASEIFNLLESGILDNAANLTNDDQLFSICDWIVNL